MHVSRFNRIAKPPSTPRRKPTAHQKRDEIRSGIKQSCQLQDFSLIKLDKDYLRLIFVRQRFRYSS